MALAELNEIEQKKDLSNWISNILQLMKCFKMVLNCRGTHRKNGFGKYTCQNVN